MFRQVLRSESSDDEATSSSEDENSDVTMEDDLQEEGGGNTDTKGKGKQKADVPKGKGKQKAEDSHFDTGFFDEDLAAGVEYDSDSGPHFERRAPGPAVWKVLVLRIAADWRARQRAKAGAGLYEAQKSVENSYFILREPEYERHARQSSIQHPFPATMMAPHKPHNLTSSALLDNELALSLPPAHSTCLEKATGRGLESQAKELVSKRSRTDHSANEKPSVSSGESQRQLRLQNAAKGRDRAQISFSGNAHKKIGVCHYFQELLLCSFYFEVANEGESSRDQN
ncbi:hypothetical protein R3P38DRAFT_2758767 [Favolaschia claudopus]|uniref:Uncharacterized protein n=1 Tax=Favolaschia claudopus TaxID=2862362 RepID=A0AAW0E774_9AGAR